MEEKTNVFSVIIVPIIMLIILVVFIIVMLILNSKRDVENLDEQAAESNSVVVNKTETESEKIDRESNEYNELPPEERNPISEDEFEALPEDEVYVNPKDMVYDIIPGIVPTKEQAQSYLYKDALYCYDVIGIFSGLPVVLSDPWATDDGGWACYVNNEVGTTVLWAIVDKDGEINMGLYGSIYIDDFVGVMYNVEGDNPDEETLEKLEHIIYEKYKNTKVLKIKSFNTQSVTLVNKAGVETVIDINS